MNLRLTLAAVLKAVTDQILEELDEMRFVAENGRKRVAGNGGCRFLNSRVCVFQCNMKNLVQVNRRNDLLGLAGELRIFEQVRQQFPHALGSFGDESDADP